MNVRQSILACMRKVLDFQDRWIPWSGLGVIGGLVLGWYTLKEYQDAQFRNLQYDKLLIAEKLLPSISTGGVLAVQFIEPSKIEFQYLITNNSSFGTIVTTLDTYFGDCDTPMPTEQSASKPSEFTQIGRQSFLMPLANTQINFSSTLDKDHWSEIEVGSIFYVGVDFIAYFQMVSGFDDFLRRTGMERRNVVLGSKGYDTPSMFQHWRIGGAIVKVSQTEIAIFEGDDCDELDRNYKNFRFF